MSFTCAVWLESYSASPSFTGKLTSVDASIIANGSAYTATIHGLLSGAGASSVTGVFHTNDSRPDYASAFVAKK